MREIMNLVEGIAPHDIYENGTRAELLQLHREIDSDPEGGAVRGLLIDDTLLFWDSGLATHNDVRVGRRGISIFLNPRDVMIDDDYLRHGAPDGAIERIKAHPRLKAIYGETFPVRIRRHVDGQ